MNACFYVAIDRLPLGTVAAIEFLPVIALAALGARSLRNAAALGLAVPGVYLLTGVQFRGGAARRGARVCERAAVRRVHRARSPRGTPWRAQRHRRLGCIDADRRGGRDLIGGWEVLPALVDQWRCWRASASAVLLGDPYVSDQLHAVLPRATYALMVSLLPATATVIGIAVLAQIPSWVEVAGVALVIAGVAIHRQAPEPQTQSAPAERASRRPGPVPTQQQRPRAPEQAAEDQGHEDGVIELTLRTGMKSGTRSNGTAR